jgi:hypothetical protein
MFLSLDTLSPLFLIFASIQVEPAPPVSTKEAPAAAPSVYVLPTKLRTIAEANEDPELCAEIELMRAKIAELERKFEEQKKRANKATQSRKRPVAEGDALELPVLPISKKPRLDGGDDNVPVETRGLSTIP